jgi:hypothetical protein
MYRGYVKVQYSKKVVLYCLDTNKEWYKNQDEESYIKIYVSSPDDKPKVLGEINDL